MNVFVYECLNCLCDDGWPWNRNAEWQRWSLKCFFCKIVSNIWQVEIVFKDFQTLGVTFSIFMQECDLSCRVSRGSRFLEHSNTNVVTLLVYAWHIWRPEHASLCDRVPFAWQIMGLLSLISTCLFSSVSKPPPDRQSDQLISSFDTRGCTLFFGRVTYNYP